MKTVSREMAYAFVPLCTAFWPRHTLTEQERRLLSRASLDAAVEAVTKLRSELDVDERALVITHLISNYLSTQVIAEVSKGLYPALLTENFIQAK